MTAKKIKIFLGGIINSTNAQNLNCLALAKYLNKERFTVCTLEVFSGNLESQQGKIPGVRIFKCFKPFRISSYLGFLWGIWNCDVVYLPKGELWKFNRLLLRLLNKKSFSTAEGILDDENLKSAMEALGSMQDVTDCYLFTDKKFPITKFIGKYNQEKQELKSEVSVLYLGCDSDFFRNNSQRDGSLFKVVYIGRLMKRKGIYDFLKIAQHFPELQFYIFGDGEEKTAIETFLITNQLGHIKLMGIASHQTLATFLKETDLHILPSRSEGFPKVILETAAAGVPSIVYDDYGAQEWITNGVDGWVVKSVGDMISIVNNLKNNPQKLESVSQEAIKLATSFDWKVKVKDWEEVIEKLYNE
ncbi:MAG: hypothetical protein RLZZ540_355 [Bacteroidota bacterium]|jgi:glycosyltransferase involved in cell wall biosynthesis